MERADDDMKQDPYDYETARPVATVKHEHAADDLKDAREVNHPMSLQVYNELRPRHSHVRPQSTDESDAAEDYEEPTDDRDCSGALHVDENKLTNAQLAAIEHYATGECQGGEAATAIQQPTIG